MLTCKQQQRWDALPHLYPDAPMLCTVGSQDLLLVYVVMYIVFIHPGHSAFLHVLQLALM